MVLQGLQRSLRSMRAEWEIEFATSGLAALDAMSESPFDVVITDMRMPGMDGAQLLDQVKAKFPRTVRIILSGQSDRETILRSVGPSHQYLSKPCDVDELKQRLTRAFGLRDMFDNPALKEVVCRLKAVPSLPKLYVAVTEALRSPDTSIATIGDLIAKDMGMAAKVLQLVNSAFFGLSCQVSNPQQATALIGIENLKALVLSVQVFDDLGEHALKELGFLWNHSMITASFAKAITQVQKCPRAFVDEAFAAGLLHDIGLLVLASAFGAEFQRVLQCGLQSGKGLESCEADAFGCTHAAVGAYLLGLWGLSDAVVEAVAWHDHPSLAQPKAFTPLIAVHAADYCDRVVHPYPGIVDPIELDEPLLTRLGIQGQLPAWRLACEEIAARSQNRA